MAVKSDFIELVSIKQPFSGNSSRRIVRLLNLAATAETVTITFASHIVSAAFVNLVEQERRPLALEKGSALVTFKAFEIRTIELTTTNESGTPDNGIPSYEG